MGLRHLPGAMRNRPPTAFRPIPGGSCTSSANVGRVFGRTPAKQTVRTQGAANGASPRRSSRCGASGPAMNAGWTLPLRARTEVPHPIHRPRQQMILSQPISSRRSPGFRLVTGPRRPLAVNRHQRHSLLNSGICALLPRELSVKRLLPYSCGREICTAQHKIIPQQYAILLAWMVGTPDCEEKNNQGKTKCTGKVRMEQAARKPSVKAILTSWETDPAKPGPSMRTKPRGARPPEERAAPHESG